MGTLDLLFGGGGGYFVRSLFSLCFVYCYFGFVVLLLEVCSIFFSCSAYWSCFVFSIACSCKWCLGLILVYFASHLHVNESCVVVCVCLGHFCM